MYFVRKYQDNTQKNACGKKPLTVLRSKNTQDDECYRVTLVQPPADKYEVVA